MITFNEIFETLRKEKNKDSLQLLPRNFLQESQNYFDDKSTILNKDSDMFDEITSRNKKILENALSNFKDLLTLRKKKILNLAFLASEVGINKKDYENMLNFEKELYESVVKSLTKADKDKKLEMHGDSQNEQKHKLVRFTEEVPAFLDMNGNEIGPFQKGEIANLDIELLEILSKDNRVEIMEN